MNIELARFLERILCGTNSFDLKPLCIVPGKRCWVLYIDVMVLASGGNLFDTISVATLAALSNVRIPSIKVSQSFAPAVIQMPNVTCFQVVESEGEKEIELSDDPEAFTKLAVDTVPVCVTMTRIGIFHFLTLRHHLLGIIIDANN